MDVLYYFFNLIFVSCHYYDYIQRTLHNRYYCYCIYCLFDLFICKQAFEVVCVLECSRKFTKSGCKGIAEGTVSGEPICRNCKEKGEILNDR